MRRKLAIGILGFLVVLAAATLTWAEEGAPKVSSPGEGQHQWGGGPHPPEEWSHRQFAGRSWDGERDGRRMGWEGSGRGRFGGGERIIHMVENPRVRQYLGLTDEQVTRLHIIAIDAEKTSVQNHADLQLRHIELRELLRADNPDREAIMRKLDEVNALRGKIEKERLGAFLDARGVLTPDQIKKVKTYMENRGAGFGRGPMMERRGGMAHRPGVPGGPGAPPSAPAPKPPGQ